MRAENLNLGEEADNLTWSKCPCRGSTLDHSMLNLLAQFGKDHKTPTATRFAGLLEREVLRETNS